MIEWATWASVIVLGPGSVAVFVWFLLDLKRIFRRDGDGDGHGGGAGGGER